MTEVAAFTWALYQSSWLPCRVLAEDQQTGTLEVRLTDRTGTHEVCCGLNTSAAMSGAA